MDVFFQFIAAIALFIGIGSVVFSSEISRRCQEIITTRLTELDAGLEMRVSRQDKVIAKAIREMRDTVETLEERVKIQTQEIDQLRKIIDPLVKDLEKRAEQEKKIEAYMKTRAAQRL